MTVFADLQIMSLLKQKNIQTYNLSSKKPIRSIYLSSRSPIAKNTPRANNFQRNIQARAYPLHAKLLIQQLQREQELNLLKKQSFVLKKTAILDILRKCDSDTKSLIMIKLVTLSRLMGIELGQEIYDLVIEMISFLVSLGNKDQNQFCQLILLERIDENMAFIIKCYPPKVYLVIKKVQPLYRKFNQLKIKMKRLMVKEEYETFLLCLSLWNLKIYSKQKEQKRLTASKPNDSKASKTSMISEISDDYQERLRKFNEANQEIKKKLQMIGGSNKKKRNFRKSNSINAGSTKRVSTTWGKPQQVINANSSKQVIKKGQQTPGNCSKFVNILVKQSILRLDEESGDNAEFSNMTISKQKNQEFKAFYFFTIIKGNIRIISVSNIGITVDNRLTIFLESSDFCYWVTMPKISGLAEHLDNLKLKKIILSHLNIKQKQIWNVLTSFPKYQPEAEQQFKNMISQLLEEEEKFTLYGFIKRFNAYFFSKFQSCKAPYQEGKFTIYNSNFQDKLQVLEITNWKETNFIEFNEDTCSSVDSSIVSQLDKTIIVSECKIGYKQNEGRIKLWRNNWKEKAIKRKSQKSIVQTLRIGNNRFCLLSKTERETSFSYENLRFQAKSNYLFVLEAKKSSDEFELSGSKFVEQRFLPRFHRKIGKDHLVILNRRIGQPRYVKILYQMSFLKRVRAFGIVLCKIFIFRPEQSYNSIIELYAPQNQKIYIFEFPVHNIRNPLELQESKGAEFISENLRFFLKLLKFKKIQPVMDGSQSQQLRLLMELDDKSFIGQELIYRICSIENNFNLKYMDTVMLKQPKNINSKDSNYILIERKIQRTTNNLRNMIVDRMKIDKRELYKKCNKYNEFVEALKNQLRRSFKSPNSFFQKPTNIHYYCSKRGGNRLNTLKLNENNSIQFKTFNVEDKSVQKRVLSRIQFFPFDPIIVIETFSNKKLLKYAKKLLRDPFLHNSMISC